MPVTGDWNGNGTQDPGEEGMPGVTVTLLLDADNNGSYETTLDTQVTDATGYYIFDGLLDGKYQVVVPAPGSLRMLNLPPTSRTRSRMLAMPSPAL